MQDRTANKKDKTAGRTIFSSEEFQGMMARYLHGNLQYRINNAIVDHSQKHANTYNFNLYWTDSEHIQPLKVTLTCSDSFSIGYSRFLSEGKLVQMSLDVMKHALKPGPSYYRLDVEQIVSDQPKIANLSLLTMWFTLDGFIGELRNFNAGENFSGNEVMRVFRYFNDFFNIKNLFIYDDTVIECDQRTRLPLRLMTAIATGKTWLEQQLPGLRLFDSTQLSVGAQNPIRQDSVKRQQCLRELQTLPLRRWHAMLNAERQALLEALHGKYLPLKKEKSSYRLFKNNEVDKSKAAMFGDDTLQMLAIAVHQAAKEQKKITQDLLQLNDLLCGNIMLEFGHALTAAGKEPADYWVKSRAQKLLWESLVWVYQAPEQETKAVPKEVQRIEYGNF